MNKSIKYISSIGVFALLLGTAISCSEEEPIYVPPTFKLNEVLNIMRTTATFSGSISGDMSKISEYGFEYSTVEEFTTSTTNKVVVGETPTSSSCQAAVTGLEANERYYYRLYATTGASKVYSEAEYFQTAASSAPLLSALVVDSIGENLARFKCTIEDIGDEHLIEYGVGYKTQNDQTYIPIPSDSIIPLSAAGADNTFFVEIVDLQPATKYSFRPYAKNSTSSDGSTGSREGYGEIVEKQTESLLSADVTTSEIADGHIGINSIQVSATFNGAAGSNDIIKACGFCWSENNTMPVITDDTLMLDPVRAGELFYATIKDLKPKTLYYVRAYAINTVNGVERVGYGEVYPATTLSRKVPILEIETEENEWGGKDFVFETEATSIHIKADITNYDSNALVEKGLIWSKTKGNITLEEAKKTKTFLSLDVKTGGKSIDGTIEGLEMYTSYYVKAYAVYRADGIDDVGYSEVLSIRTQNFQAPSLELEINDEKVTRNTAEFVGRVRDEGNGTISERGFVYIESNISPEPTLKTKGVNKVVADETFTKVIKELSYNTQYAARSYAISKLAERVDTVYSGGWHFFTTKSVLQPNFNNVNLSDATYCSFKATCGITELGDGKLLEKGFYWKADGTDFENGVDSLIVKSGNNDEFSAVVEGLQSDKWHYVGAYTKLDVDGDIFVHRSGWNSIWVHGPNMPSFNYNTDGGAYKQLKLTATITSMGDGEIIEEGFCWRMVGEEDWEDPTLELNDGFVTIKDTLSTFTHTIMNLEPGKEYYSRAYVKVKLKNGERIGYSGTHSITLSSVELPEVSDWFNISEHTRNSVVVRGSLNNDGNGVITHRGFVVSDNAKNPLPAIGDCDYKWDDVDESFTKTLTGLKHNTEYALRAFVVASFDGVTDTIYNRSARTFWTASVQLPEFKRPTFDKVDLTSFTVSSVITSIGEGKLKEKGFCWNRVTSDFDLNTETTTSQVVTGDSLYIDMKNLETNTTYYLKAYAKVEVDGIEYTAYSDQASQRTSSYNHTSLHNTTVDGEKTTRNSAFLSGAFNSSGNGTIVEKGFVLSKTSVTSEPTLENNVKKVIAADDFTATVTGLDWNTEYAVRTYAICKWEASDFKETVYSNWRTTFRTKNVELPKFNNVAVDSITYSSFKVASGIASLGDGEDALVEKGFVWLLNEEQNYWDAPTFDAYTGYMKVDSDSIKSFEVKVENLLPNQRYTVRSYAKVTIDGQETVGYSNAHSLSTPSLGIDCWLESQATTCNVEVEFREEADKVKDVYVNVAEMEGENVDKWTKFALTKDEATGRYKGVVDNLRGNTNYYLKLIYQYAGNDVVCDGVWSFTTKRTPSVNDNVSPGKKEDE